MNEHMLVDYVEEIFRGVLPSEKVTEQKEEVFVNLRERVIDYMQGGLSFDAAFETAKAGLGDIDELTAPFAKYPAGFGSQTPPSATGGYASGGYASGGHASGGFSSDAPSGDKHKRVKVSFGDFGLAVASPFVYVLIGLLQNNLTDFMPYLGFVNWWAWGWVIMPVSGIICAPISRKDKFAAISPFVYVLIGLLQNDLGSVMPWLGFINWWAWGWVIIPLSGLIYAGLIRISRE